MIAPSRPSRGEQRPTRQQTAVFAVFEACRRPLSVLEVLELGRREIPRLGIATVYRHVRGFVAAGRLIPVLLPGGIARYELAGLGRHHHFRCAECDRVFDLHGPIQGVEQLLPQRFRLDRQELILHGRCADCSNGD